MSKNPIEKLAGFAVVTGASSGIGLELAKLAARDRCDLLLVADEGMDKAEAEARAAGAASVETLEADLATESGLDALEAAIGTRAVDALFANAGEGYGGAFLECEWDHIARVIDTNIKGTVSLIHRLGRKMRARGSGRILVTGSIAGAIPGPFNLTYNSTKAFIDDFCVGLAEEWKDSEVVISCLLPGAADTRFFERAGMEDTRLAESAKVPLVGAEPADVAKGGYEALLKGETQDVHGFMNKLQHVFAGVLPSEVLAKMHSHLARSPS
ncbi:SDR family oxidoreductase [Erythrobacter sp.]|uniref:SDR family NAD(P)-dependent oxidoreductase n=1 Tax=Erythrobacter sp. TaxID=1042 RepID=UPI001425DA03|nr:SDR family NAD(P)-dependent oxidoreductase [Erythrobacter sp.]QIQ85365.1 MAG: SDR family NAD(P)-dependent oxidoreductase [Erythrobacter sp.]